jgi:hypothetical protein
MKAVRVSKYLMPHLVLVALLGSVVIARAAGAWKTSGRGEVMVDESGQADPAGIKGWMTLESVSQTYGMPLDALYTLIGAGPEIPASTELRELEGLLGSGVRTVREGVAAYLAGTWTPEDGPYQGTESHE